MAAKFLSHNAQGSQQQQYSTKMNRAGNDNCGADTVDNDSTHSIYDDVLSIISINDATTHRHDSDEVENDSLQSTYDDLFLFQPKNYEMSNSRRWESFQTGIDRYDSVEVFSSLDYVNDDSVCALSQRKMIRSRSWESFRTGISSYDSADVLSLDDSYDDDLPFESKFDLDGSRSDFSVRRTMYEEYYGTGREINNLSSRVQIPQQIYIIHTDERIFH